MVRCIRGKIRVIRSVEVIQMKFDKEVFVKHEQAPTAPSSKGYVFFVDFKYIFYENSYFWRI